MGEVEQLVKRVQNLRPRDFAEFRAWFLESDDRVRDREKSFTLLVSAERVSEPT